jgi:cysteine synthase
METGLELPRITAIDTEVLPPHWARRFEKDRVRLYIAELYDNEAKNGKFYPAHWILSHGVARGDHKGAKVAIDSTSGNYGVALEMARRRAKKLNPKFPIERIAMAVAQSLPKGKRELLTELGIELIDAKDSIDAMRVAKEEAEKHGYWYTKQYWNPDNSAGWRPVAESLADQLANAGLVAWGVGSGGGCSGSMPVFQERFKDRSFGLWRVAVVAEDGEKIGGVRDEAALEPGSLEWRGENIDEVRFVTERQSNLFCSALWRQGIHVGPSTGFVAEGACLAMRSLSIMRKLDKYRAADGDVHILVPALDKRTPYRSEFERMGFYHSKLEW